MSERQLLHRWYDRAGDPFDLPDVGRVGHPHSDGLRFEGALDHSAVALNLCDLDGRFLRVNRAMCEFVGRDARILIGGTWQDITHPDDVAIVEGLTGEVISGARDHYRMVTRYLRPDGSVVWGDLTLSCARTGDGAIDYLIAQIIDVTEREEALAAREHSDRLLAAMMDSAPVGMGVTTMDGAFVRVNPAMAEFFGIDPQSALSLRWQDLTPPQVLPEELVLLEELLSGRRDSYRLLKPFPMPGGTDKCGLLSVACIRDDDGSPTMLVGQIVDVTPQEEALARLQATLDSMLDPHALFEPVRDDAGAVVDLVYASVNGAAAAYLGRPRNELVGRGVGELFDGAAVAALLAWCSTTLAEGATSVDGVCLPSSSDGEPRWFDVRAVRVGDAVSFTWRDVSERHRVSRELAESEAGYRLLADNATDVIIRTDIEAGIVFVSPSVVDVLGWQPGELAGKRVSDLMHPDDLAAARARQQEIIASGAPEGRITARFATADGGWRWMSDHGRAILADDGSIVGGIDSLRDMQAEHDAQVALAAREAELRGVIDSLIDPWVLLRAVRDDDGRIVDFVYADANDAACAFNGTPRDRMIGMRLLDVLPDHLGTGIFARYAEVVESGRPLADDDEPFRRPGDGVERRFDNRAVKVGDGLSLMWRDVTERYEARQTLRRHAEQDLLTGVANRRQFDRQLEEMAARAPRTGTLLALLYCDVDHFKDVNDTLGHAAGDGILAAVAHGIRSAVREGDIVARLGGDEFVIILDGVRGPRDAQAVAEKVARAASTPIETAGITVVPRLSIGVSIARHDEDPHAALARADDAMYRAKRAGRNRVVVDSTS